jgi:hypothetical protein
MNRQPMPNSQFSFTLPVGMVDAEGYLHRHGVMRRTTGQDEIWVSQDAQTQDNPAYGILYRLSQVITHLGQFSGVTPELLEQLFLKDFMYLREVYTQINQPGVEGMNPGEF